ncbi:hypothetical protein CEXT_536871 [Caerostris extrusa]|uniref:Uncharacterized protein n=1 Tax=Caerostris extrusa TaxID=172846 RepID=A0AAV4RY66_CAEEX|nr:hypothetical protein CEXT_536871 [Caerostris extrusa]
MQGTAQCHALGHQAQSINLKRKLVLGVLFEKLQNCPQLTISLGSIHVFNSIIRNNGYGSACLRCTSAREVRVTKSAFTMISDFKFSGRSLRKPVLSELELLVFCHSVVGCCPNVMGP